MDTNNELALIHIGKCGGTTLLEVLNKSDVKCKNLHLKKPDPKQNYLYILWIRNPLKRFVSAFNFAHDIINTDITPLKNKELSLTNTLAPQKIRTKIDTGRAFNKTYEELINYFGTANSLAESLTHNDEKIRAKAYKLMTRKEEHIYKGIGWYLDSGRFILNAYNKILHVGKCETMESDLEILSSKLDINFDTSIYTRKNDSKLPKYLSRRAIQNLIYFYKDKDYRALNTLYEYGFIGKVTLNSYYEYPFFDY